MVLRKELAFFSAVIVFGVAVSIVAYTIGSSNPSNLAMRLALCIAATMTAFLKEITLFFKKPFTRVHHYFAAAGLVLITLHPLVSFFVSLNPNVFIPNFGSLYQFLFFGGKQH